MWRYFPMMRCGPLPSNSMGFRRCSVASCGLSGSGQSVGSLASCGVRQMSMAGCVLCCCWLRMSDCCWVLGAARSLHRPHGGALRRTL